MINDKKNLYFRAARCIRPPPSKSTIKIFGLKRWKRSESRKCTSNGYAKFALKDDNQREKIYSDVEKLKDLIWRNIQKVQDTKVLFWELTIDRGNLILSHGFNSWTTKVLILSFYILIKTSILSISSWLLSLMRDRSCCQYKARAQLGRGILWWMSMLFCWWKCPLLKGGIYSCLDIPVSIGWELSPLPPQPSGRICDKSFSNKTSRTKKILTSFLILIGFMNTYISITTSPQH